MRGGAVLKGELMGYTERLNVGCERQRAVKKDFKIFGLSNWNNKVNSTVSPLNGMGKDNRTGGLEKMSEAWF